MWVLTSVTSSPSDIQWSVDVNSSMSSLKNSLNLDSATQQADRTAAFRAGSKAIEKFWALAVRPVCNLQLFSRAGRSICWKTQLTLK
jgi:hypothetical protein